MSVSAVLCQVHFSIFFVHNANEDSNECKRHASTLSIKKSKIGETNSST